MTDINPLSRRALLQMIFGASLVLSSVKPVFADGPGENSHESGGGENGSGENGSGYNSHDDNESDDDSDDDSGGSTGTSASLNSTSPGGQHGLMGHQSKPNNPNGRLLNQDEVKSAIASGNAATLPLLLTYMENKFPGKVLDVKMRQLDSKYVYEVKLLSNVVFLRTVLLDAKTLSKL